MITLTQNDNNSGFHCQYRWLTHETISLAWCQNVLSELNRFFVVFVDVDIVLVDFNVASLSTTQVFDVLDDLNDVTVLFFYNTVTSFCAFGNWIIKHFFTFTVVLFNPDCENKSVFTTSINSMWQYGFYFQTFFSIMSTRNLTLSLTIMSS